MDHELDKVIAWIDDRDADAEQWLNEQAAERFNLRAESEALFEIQIGVYDF